MTSAGTGSAREGKMTSAGGLLASQTHDYWVLKDKILFQKISLKVNAEQMIFDRSMMTDALKRWSEAAKNMTKTMNTNAQHSRFLNVMKDSTRCSRSTMEKEEIRRFLLAHMSCIPKSINFSEMDTLCNEIDWIPYVGRSILFLQGDFGNCYYMLARGRVGLYLEPSKDREMEVAREFGHLRQQPFEGINEDLDRIGNLIFNLSAGAGFGEYAILAATNKIRSAAAVAIDEDSTLLILHADTYNAVLRQHHYRQKQLSSATALLQELPMFRHHNFSNIASVAYTMRSQTYSNNVSIVAYGDLINNVLLISSGQVKVYAAPKGSEHAGRVVLKIHKRIPKLAIALLGRGSIIGEMEMQKGLRTFQLTYESGSSSTEILEMPATVYEESMSHGGVEGSLMHKSIEQMNQSKELRRVGRMTRAYEAMKNMMTTEGMQTKDLLAKILPVIVDTPSAKGSKKLSGGSGGGGGGGGDIHDVGDSHKRTGAGAYYGDNKPTVMRKASFSVQLCADNHPVPMPMSMASGSFKAPTPAILLRGSAKFNPNKEDATSPAAFTGSRKISIVTSPISPTDARSPTGAGSPKAVSPTAPRGSAKRSPRGSLSFKAR
ncbi:hypothetical protein B484DRAFT_452613 [Ochromonadaceae sp. CCMP2298]|nr:hypothetical protein B484DRAFT_452613 [Ochromonadaceae sp. CCMP2298]